MTFAWYGHLFFREKYDWFKSLPWFAFVMMSWGLAFFEYVFQVPANRLGYVGQGGKFDLFELKAIQEGLSILIFVLLNVFMFKSGKLGWNHLFGFSLIAFGIFLVFQKN